MNGLRLAHLSDLTDIMDVVNDAQKFLKKQNSGQWQDGAPTIATIAEDSINDRFYVWEEEGVIVGIIALLNHDEDYDHLTSGQWRFPTPYLVIHRFAVKSDHHSQGIATSILRAVEGIAKGKSIQTIRVDTHEKNIPMINLLVKNGFEKCGEVMIEGTKPRIAFDKSIEG
ncbi:MAG: GNAT family N-acetyltransferase [Bacilli bacterium]|jgi:GNAT superfamily N-acetyltransferase